MRVDCTYVFVKNFEKYKYIGSDKRDYPHNIFLIFP